MADLKQLGSGGALQQKMLSKSTDVIQQVGKEIDNMARIFHENKVSLGHTLCLLLQITHVVVPNTHYRVSKH